MKADEKIASIFKSQILPFIARLVLELANPTYKKDDLLELSNGIFKVGA